MPFIIVCGIQPTIVHGSTIDFFACFDWPDKSRRPQSRGSSQAGESVQNQNEGSESGSAANGGSVFLAFFPLICSLPTNPFCLEFSAPLHACILVFVGPEEI